MTYPPKVQAALGVLAEAGLKRNSCAPPLHLLLWRFGAEVPPPHFAGVMSNLLLFGAPFGLMWGVTMWFFHWSALGMAITGAFSSAAITGVLFGLLMALHYRHDARKHRLPDWSVVSTHHG